jgi:hypothetical protein
MNSCNCSDCCHTPTYLGCFDPCGDLETGIDADYTGDYILKVGYLGTTIEITAAQTAFTELVFPLEDLNEHFTFTAEIIDPNGDSVGFIKFTTSHVYQL